MKMLLVDGHSLLYRAYHALSGLTNGAVHGFFLMLLRAIADEKPDCCAVAFDVHAPTFRHEQYDEYKATRSPMPEDMRPQVPMTQELLAAMHIPIVTCPGFEADDVLGTLSRQCAEAGVDALLVTGDRDSFQLAGEHVAILYTKHGVKETERVTEDWIEEKYGLKPAQLIDVKGLMGDASDNIPGVPGIGEKTALKLIRQYGSLEETLDRAEAEQKGKLRERLMDNRQQAIFSKTLATIERHAPVRADFEAYKLTSFAEAIPRFRELGFKALLNSLEALSGSAAPTKAKEAQTETIVWEEPRPIESAQALKNAVQALPPYRLLSLFLGENLSLATEAGTRLTVPLSGDLFHPGVAEEAALSALKGPLEAESAKAVYDNKALRAHLERAGVALRGPLNDVMLAAYVLDAQRKSYKAEALLEGADMAEPAAALLELARAQAAALKDDQLTKLYEQIELPLSQALYDMERAGFLVDADELKRLGAIYGERVETLKKQIVELAGYAVNVNSPKQLSELLFDKLALSGGKKTSTGYSTSADALELLSDSHPIVPLILEYRKYQKLNSTYVEALLRLRGADGRIHTSFDQVSTATGRISSLEPNLQNIPVRTELGREIRRAFVAPEGWQLVDADYSQIELRVLAHMSGDPVMLDAFQKGQDIHRRTAAEVYGVPLNEVTGAMRSNAKAVNFGIVYGISDFGLAKNIGVSRKEAGQFIERYFARYPGIKRFMESLVATGKAQGYVETLFGRRRYLRELQSDNYNIRSFGERAAMNSPIQGTAADIIKLAMVRANKALKTGNYRARLILQVHDELIVEAPQEEVPAVTELLKRAMEGVVALDAPLVVDIAAGGNWNACK